MSGVTDEAVRDVFLKGIRFSIVLFLGARAGSGYGDISWVRYPLFAVTVANYKGI